jgi:GGDEF domain-containing protein
MLEFMGEELKCKRVIVFEDMHNGRYAGKYAWFDKSLGRRSIDLLYVPEKGFVDEVLDSYSANGNSFSISDIETYRDINQNIYNLLRSFDVESLVLNPLSVDGNVTGLLLLLDLPVDLIDEASPVAALTSYFLSQLILRRDDQKRMRTYTYNDSLSGAQNRRAYEEFVRNGLDLSSPFGYLSCEITDLEEISERDGFEAGDRKVIDIVAILGEIFGRSNVYRMVGSRFAAFGFETDETYFRDDVARFKEKVREAGINTAVGYVYCQNGTMDMKTFIRRAGQMIKEEEKNEHKH